jgi:hypothetical protein
MPRLARLEGPGSLHHIMITGIERRKIFRDAKDRENFLERLGNLLLETNTVKISLAGVGYAVQRGEMMAREGGYQLYPPLAGYPMRYLPS